MSSRSLGLLLAAAGCVLLLLGLLVWTGALAWPASSASDRGPASRASTPSRSPALPGGWFGHLPGDIRIERPGVRIYFSLTSMLLVSLAVSLVAALLRRLF